MTEQIIEQIILWGYALVTFLIIFGTARRLRNRDALEQCIQHHPSNTQIEGQ